MNGWVGSGYVSGLMDRWMFGRLNGLVDGWMDGWKFDVDKFDVDFVKVASDMLGIGVIR